MPSDTSGVGGEPCRRGYRSDFLVQSRSSWTAGVFAPSTLFACNGFWR